MAWLSSAPMSLGALSTARRSAGVGGRLAPPPPPPCTCRVAHTGRRAPVGAPPRPGVAVAACGREHCRCARRLPVRFQRRGSRQPPPERGRRGAERAPPHGPSPHRLQSGNGRQQAPLSTATVSMVHSVPELMVSSEVSAPGRGASALAVRLSRVATGGGGCCAWALPGGALRGAGLGLGEQGSVRGRAGPEGHGQGLGAEAGSGAGERQAPALACQQA